MILYLIEVFLEIIMILFCIIVETFIISKIVLDAREQNLKYKKELLMAKKRKKENKIKIVK